MKIFNFGGGVNHHIRMMISDTAYNCRRVLRIKFFVNFFTLRVLVFIDLKKNVSSCVAHLSHQFCISVRMSVLFKEHSKILGYLAHTATC